MLILYIAQLIAALNQLGAEVVTIEQGPYTMYQVSENTMIETYEYENDSTLVVETVCAPICSSHACVYNKEWLLLHSISEPEAYIVPQARIDSLGYLSWEDNSVLLDDTQP